MAHNIECEQIPKIQLDILSRTLLAAMERFYSDPDMTHNHPRSGSESGLLGGTFSTGDLDNFVRFSQTTYRATAAEGTYSISKLKGFDSKGFKSYYTSESSKNRGTYNATMKTLNSSVRSGSMSYNDYRAEANKAFNTYLVAEHNSLRAGQKLYGYHYTLERRSK